VSELAPQTAGGATRRRSREVKIGGVGIGGANPIRVQSMTTTDTRDVVGTTDQIERLVDAGCHIVRITTPSLRDVEALAGIGQELRSRRIAVPLVADVHFTPNAALAALDHVDKVRINPGNYADRKRFAAREYSDAEYAGEVDRVAERFRPLVVRARELGRVLRIGTNHGSLSDRILNRYGDTPAGMVESAIEFLEVCEAESFDDVVFSMKASNPGVTLEAYRLLATRLDARLRTGAPLHLGVTEAGAGRDARVKSAIGIGALLEEGLGDTIRVSLTEDPVREIPVARALADRFAARFCGAPADRGEGPSASSRLHTSPHASERRDPAHRAGTGGEGRPSRPVPTRRTVRVDLELGAVPSEPSQAADRLVASIAHALDRRCEGVVVDLGDVNEVGRAAEFARLLPRAGLDSPVWVRGTPSTAAAAAAAGLHALACIDDKARRQTLCEVASAAAASGVGLEWQLCDTGSPVESGRTLDATLEAAVDASRAAGIEAPAFSIASDRFLAVHRRVARRLATLELDAPIALRHPRPIGVGDDAALLYAATDLGALLCEGVGNAVSLRHGRAPLDALDLLYRILQGARVRVTRAEFISCPSCGRTQFDLETVTERIRSRTQHLRDVKIAIMGCIVNGPGEMADADFGYVGSGPGRIHLYVGQERVASHVPEAEAPDRLEELIRTHGRWAPAPISPAPTASEGLGDSARA